jgi:hypothetical protein
MRLVITNPNPMKPAILLFVCFFLFKPCFGQENQSINRKLSYSLTGGTGFSYFHYNTSRIKEKFASPEFRVGILVQKQLTSRFSIQSGLRLGLKLKTNSIYSDNENLMRPHGSIADIDETTSKSDHYFLEIPLTFQYQYKKLRMGGGVVYRNLVQFDNYRYVNYYTTIDVGITPSVSYQLNDRISIGAEYYFGMIRFFEGTDWNPSAGQVNYKARNRYAQIFIAYSLGKK